MFTRRAFVALAALALATGCSKTGNVDFTITRQYSNVNAPGGAFGPTTQNVDLSTDAGEAWSHRDKVKSLDLVGIDGTVTAINSGGPATVSGTITLVRGTERATIGSWTGEVISAAPHSVNIVLNDAGMAIVNEALRDDGKFAVEFAGSSVGAINFNATVALHMKLSYKINVP